MYLRTRATIRVGDKGTHPETVGRARRQAQVIEATKLALECTPYRRVQ